MLGAQFCGGLVLSIGVLLVYMFPKATFVPFFDPSLLHCFDSVCSLSPIHGFLVSGRLRCQLVGCETGC